MQGLLSFPGQRDPYRLQCDGDPPPLSPPATRSLARELTKVGILMVTNQIFEPESNSKQGMHSRYRVRSYRSWQTAQLQTHLADRSIS